MTNVQGTIIHVHLKINCCSQLCNMWKHNSHLNSNRVPFICSFHCAIIAQGNEGLVILNVLGVYNHCTIIISLVLPLDRT